MTRFRVAAVLLSSCLTLTAACGQVESAANKTPVTVRVSTGSATGNFRPFSEALAKSYATLMPDIRVESVDTPGSVHNIEALDNGSVDIGLAQAGIAYMSFNGQLPESKRALRNLRGMAVLNASAVHLLVGPRSAIRSMDELRGRRVGIGPEGGGLAVTSQMVLRGYF